MDAATDWVIDGGQYALDFDGSNDYVDCGNAGLFATLTGITLSCWVNDRGTVAQRRYFSKWDNSRGFIFMSEGGGNITFYFYTGTSLKTLSTGTTMGTGWRLLTATWDGATIRAYYDGTQIGSDVSATGAFATGTANLWLAGSQGTGQFMNGLGADFAVWNRLLAPNEIRRLYQLGRGGMLERRRRRRVYSAQAEAVKSYLFVGRGQVIGGGTL